MTVHAAEEMAEDDLDILDIEQAVLIGQIVRAKKNDPRGTKYVIEGLQRMAKLQLVSSVVLQATSVI